LLIQKYFWKDIYCRIYVLNTDYNVKEEAGGLNLRVLHPLYIRSTRLIFALYSLLRLILLYPLVLLHSQRLTTPYDKQTYFSKLLSHHKSHSIYQSHKTHSNKPHKIELFFTDNIAIHLFVTPKGMLYIRFKCCICT